MSAGIFGLLGVILGSVLAVLKDFLTHYLKRKENGRYAAVRLIAVLEEYAQSCVSVVSDDGTCDGRPAGKAEDGIEYYVPQVNEPEPPTFPDDIDWRSISFKLMCRILSLPNNARATAQYISVSSEHSFPPDYQEAFDARQEGYAHLGQETVSLIKDLRREFRLPDPPKKFWNWGWDMEKFFKDELDKFQKHRQESDRDKGLEL